MLPHNAHTSQHIYIKIFNVNWFSTLKILNVEEVLIKSVLWILRNTLTQKELYFIAESQKQIISTTNVEGIVGDHWVYAPADASAKILQINLHKYRIYCSYCT